MKKIGKCKKYAHYNGKLIFEGENLNDYRNGKGKEYDQNGYIIYDGLYLDHARIGNNIIK